MVQIKNYNYDFTEISAIIADEIGTNYLWIAYKQNEDGNCQLDKMSANNPYQRYYSLDLPVTEIKTLKINSSYIFAVVDDEEYIGYRYLKTTPLTSSLTISKPETINESPIDMTLDSSYLYFLTPGVLSGEYAKIIKTTLTGAVDEIIDLQKSGEEIHNAVSISIDESSNLWIVTQENPSKLVRVYEDGGNYVFQSWELTT